VTQYVHAVLYRAARSTRYCTICRASGGADQYDEHHQAATL